VARLSYAGGFKLWKLFVIYYEILLLIAKFSAESSL